MERVGTLCYGGVHLADRFPRREFLAAQIGERISVPHEFHYAGGQRVDLVLVSLDDCLSSSEFGYGLLDLG